VTLFWLCIASIAFMVAQDFFGTSMVIGEAKGTKFWPGFWDGLNDFATRYGGGIIAVAVVKYSLWSWQTLVIVMCVAVTSFFTTNEVTQLQHLEDKK
jgi:hypothetical protein